MNSLHPLVHQVSMRYQSCDLDTSVSTNVILLTLERFFSQFALLGCTAQILLIPVCHVQLTQTQVELLLQFVPALQDTSELHRRVQILIALVCLLNVTRMLHKLYVYLCHR